VNSSTFFVLHTVKVSDASACLQFTADPANLLSSNRTPHPTGLHCNAVLRYSINPHAFHFIRTTLHTCITYLHTICPDRGKRCRSTPQHPDRLWGSPSLLSSGYRGTFPPGREADHSPPTSVTVKNTWIYTSTPPYVFMAYCLICWAQGQLHLHRFLFACRAYV
jgi:hypothetical protein